MIKINYYHSLIFFNLCILLSAFEFLRDNSLLILSLFLILSLGISHGALDHIKGKKLLKLLNYKSTSTFYILYVLVGLSIIILWLLFSKILLLIFLILAINAIRDDEDKAEAMGIKTGIYKVVAWSIAAFFMGLIGAVFGNMIGFIEPIEVAFPTATFGIFMVAMALLWTIVPLVLFKRTWPIVRVLPRNKR